MYVRKIKIRNLRGFGEIDLDLQRGRGRGLAGWTVIAGRNGSGKSTLLRAIALGIMVTNAGALQPDFRSWVRHGENEGSVSVELVSSEVDCLPDGSRPASVLRQSLQIGRDSDVRSGVIIDDGSKGWLLAGYGPLRRLSGHADAALQLMSGPPRQIAALATLFREDASLLGAVEWLMHAQFRAYEESSGMATRKGATALKESVLALLNDGLFPDEWRIQQVDSDGLWAERRGMSLALRDLSDGYRSIAALVLDLAQQIHRAYGELKIERRPGGGPTVPHEGVVLIDEADAHLHVSWQQKIGFWLKTHFPNIQFLVTTHSPYICQAADPGGLIRLLDTGKGASAEHVSSELFRTVVNGRADEAVMTELFGLERTHSETSEALRNRVADLETKAIRGHASRAEKAELERLSAELPSSGVALVDRALRKLGAMR